MKQGVHGRWRQQWKLWKGNEDVRDVGLSPGRAVALMTESRRGVSSVGGGGPLKEGEW